MLRVTLSWDWFFEDQSPEEKEACDNGRLAAIMQEDGDESEAIVEAVKAIDAPAEHVRLAVCEPCVADCVLVVAWDDRSVECEPDEDEADDWRL